MTHKGVHVMNTKNWKFLIVALIFICLSAEPVAATVQAPDIEWEKLYGGSGTERAYAIQQTKDDGYIVAGETRSKDGDFDMADGGINAWIFKLDSEGDIVWRKIFGGSRYNAVFSIQQTTDGGYVVGGGSLLDSQHLPGGWVIKFDGSGEIEWEKSYLGARVGFVDDIRQTTDGGYIFVCFDKAVKLDPKGVIVWGRVFSTSRGGLNPIGNTIRQTKDGGYIVASTSKGDDELMINHGSYDFLITKLDPEGDIVWQKTFGGSRDDEATSIEQTTDEGYIVAGHTRSNDGDVSVNSGSFDYWIIKLDVEGNLLWQRTLGGEKGEWYPSIQQTKDGGYIIAGRFSGGTNTYWIVKLNTDGDIDWQKSLERYPASATMFRTPMQQTADGGYILAGSVVASRKIWIVKLKPDL
jgi:hypothetical protein